MNPALLAKVLILQYLCLAFAYGFKGDLARMGYWLGASIIVASTLFMK